MDRVDGLCNDNVHSNLALFSFLSLFPESIAERKTTKLSSKNMAEQNAKAESWQMIRSCFGTCPELQLQVRSRTLFEIERILTPLP